MLTTTISADIPKLNTSEDAETNTEEGDLSLLLVEPEAAISECLEDLKARVVPPALLE
jgi:hypothetical protein